MSQRKLVLTFILSSGSGHASGWEFTKINRGLHTNIESFFKITFKNDQFTNMLRRGKCLDVFLFLIAAIHFVLLKR